MQSFQTIGFRKKDGYEWNLRTGPWRAWPKRTLPAGVYFPLRDANWANGGDMVMELVRNRVSKKYFIVLEDTQGMDFLVITPDGKVKQIEKHLFSTRDVIDPETPGWKGRLTRVQMKKYREFHNE